MNKGKIDKKILGDHKPKILSKQQHRMIKKRHSKEEKVREKEKLIIEFCLIIRELFPEEIITINPHEMYQNLVLELGENQRKLVELISHHLVKMYQNHRIQRQGKVVELAEEDILVSLKMIEKLGIEEEREKTKKTELNKQDRNYYQELLKYQGKLLQTKEIEAILGLKKSQTNELLNLLLEKKLMERYGFKNKGFYYKLVEIKNLERKETQTFEDEILDEFSDIRATFYE